MTGIFQIDWIFVDSIIIILLLLLLISVRIFKTTHRWRNSFSNKALEEIDILKIHEKIQNNYFITEKCKLTKNISTSEGSKNLPLILIVNAYYKRKLFRILTEGLVTYGFNVINLNVKKKSNFNDISTKRKMGDVWKSYISMLIDYIKTNEQVINTNYILINQSRPPVLNEAMFLESDNKCTILINPKLLMSISQNHNEKIKELFMIFSGKSRLFLQNKRLYKWLNICSNKENSKFNCLPIYKSRYSFKYYETILLGMIIDIITNELQKSEI